MEDPNVYTLVSYFLLYFCHISLHILVNGQQQVSNQCHIGTTGNVNTNYLTGQAPGKYPVYFNVGEC